MSFMKLMAEVGLDIGPFQTGLNKLNKQAESFGTSMGSSLKGAFGAYFGYQAFQKVIGDTWRSMAQIKDLADQFSTTTDEVQRLKAAAGNVGMEFEDLGGALIRMTNARSEAQKGNAESIEAFRLLGITIGDVNDPALENVDIMKRMGAALKDVNMSTQQMAAMKDVFGKGGGRMLAAIREIGNIDEPFIKQSDIDKVDAMEEAVKKMGRAIQVALSGPVGNISEGIEEAAKRPLDFLRDYRDAFLEMFSGRFSSRPSDADWTRKSSALPFGKSKAEKKTEDFYGPMPATKAEKEKQHKDESDLIHLSMEKKKLEEKSNEFLFRQASKSEQLRISKEKLASVTDEINQSEVNIMNGAENRVEIERFITARKMEQLEIMQQIEALQNKGRASFSGMGEVLGIGGEARALKSLSTSGSGKGLPEDFRTASAKTERAVRQQIEILNMIYGVLNTGKVKFAN